MENTVRVGIIDLHESVRDSLRIFLETTDDLVFVGEAESEAEIFSMCEQEKPDVLLFDFLQPEDKGVEMIACLRTIFPSLLIIILTTTINRQCVTRTVQAGAVGYLLKQVVDIDMLADAIRSACNGEFAFDEEARQFLIDIHDSHHFQLHHALI